ncbi:odorant receptor 125-7 [Danio rerio]|uniref:Olfactory receptor n=1 Tax=Danio rerio TaxID=7955 RepID=Q2PRA0_DANRE|nr:odorant receptor 125-7 [Danio rerio]ABC43367.1 odorant receptor [Danio rerio]|eukprot:NP_001121886.1 odorant receptor, family E, subfamily 125, member 7 [Danio rerio]
MDNMTNFETYTLMEPLNAKSYRYIYFMCFFLLYALILFVNIWLIVVIVIERALHEPMYIFLCNLCVNDIYGCVGFYPKFLHDLILNSYVIPSYMCAIQAFIVYSYVMCEFSTLAVMAYDRHVAICQPLDYHAKMNRFSCSILLVLCWLIPFLNMFIAVFLSNKLVPCKNHIDKLYCDNWSIVKLSCESTVINNIYGFVFISLYFVLVIVIIVSYIKLIIACKSSLECRRKFLQTCVPHVTSLINLTVAILFDTLCNRFGSDDVPVNLRFFLALEMIVVPPLVNPVIYGLKLTEVRKRILKRCMNVIKIDKA